MDPVDVKQQKQKCFFIQLRFDSFFRSNVQYNIRNTWYSKNIRRKYDFGGILKPHQK